MCQLATDRFPKSRNSSCVALTAASTASATAFRDGDANSAVAGPADAAALAGRDSADIWYRLGWSGRMRLQRRPAGLRAVALSAAGLFALGILCLVTGWVLYFLRG